ncbi:hypothetical protein [Mycobacterium sp. 852002-51057_SCH5723018]|uniref:hypothetical protein n=1 Tax=Mycobacterium sp. 852002-51057_SCH5723018 TaxID=1834094 RepID=UPI0007FB937D|nr:hypothetical protein [Mycobacterium sp. 852002-51057_SCH5723018]OBG26744.1 hypothetical protein A5764_04530 [Mycobacterium sp. 852002-51057_SCH5723018]
MSAGIIGPLLGVGLWLIFIVFMVVSYIRGLPNFKGQVLRGTARVLSARPEVMSGRWWLTPTGGYYVARTALRVEVAGRDPYDVTITDRVPKQWGGRDTRLCKGMTVAVKVDSADPRNVRFDFSQPVQPPQPV